MWLLEDRRKESGDDRDIWMEEEKKGVCVLDIGWCILGIKVLIF